MNIFSKITIKTMRKNPVRTLVTIIGIMISTAMFTAVTTFTISLITFIFRTEVYNNGSWHLFWENADYDTCVSWQQDERTEKTAIGVGLGYAYIGSSNTYKPYLYIESVNDDFLDIMPVHVTNGRLPISENEILLPDHLYENGGVSYSLGDTITVKLGERYTLNQDGSADMEYSLTQSNSFTMDNDVPTETLVEETERTFTVVGFYERPAFEDYSAPGYTALTYGGDMSECLLPYEGPEPLRKAGMLDVYVRLKSGDVGEAWDIASEAGCTSVNREVVMMSGSMLYDNIARIFATLAAVFVIIIVVGSVSMIYSAFSISVSERTKQFGLLSSVGATRKQIARSVFAEAALVSVVGIPLGSFFGIVGIGVTLHFVGSKFNSILTSPYSLELVVNGYAILIAVAIAIITVAISAFIPAARAVHVSAIDAIRMHNDIKRTGHRWRIRRRYYLTQKIFGMPGMLARRYFSRSRKKYRVTIFSLAMSIVLFIVTSTYCDYLRQFVDNSVWVMGYDLVYYGHDGADPGSADELKKLLADVAGVKDVVYINDGWTYQYEVVYDDSNTDASFKEYQSKRKELYNLDEDYHQSVYAGVAFIDDESYEEYLTQIGFAWEEYTDYENVPGILVDSIDSVLYYTDEESGEYIRYSTNYHVFPDNINELTIAESGYYDTIMNEESNADMGTEGEASAVENSHPEIIASYPVGHSADEAPKICSGYNSLLLVFPYSSKYNVQNEWLSFYFTHVDGMHDEMVESVKETLKDAGYSDSDKFFYDPYSMQQDEENMLVIINVFSYGFITLMALICVANVFNTISTNIGLRRRDFAMLRSVGLSYKGIKLMMVYECLLYGIRALIFALPASAAFSYILYRIYGSAGEFAFYIPWLSVLIAVVGAFAMVGISMVYSVSKIKKDNLIDELKEETT